MDEVVSDLDGIGRRSTRHREAGPREHPGRPSRGGPASSTRSSPCRPSRRRPWRRNPRTGIARDPPFEVKAIVQKSVLCVEAQSRDPGRLPQDPHEDGLSRVPGRATPRRAAERYREAPLDAVIFDTDGLGARLDRFAHRHAREGPRGRAAARRPRAAGPARGISRRSSRFDDKLIVLAKPIKMKDVQESIHKLLPAALSERDDRSWGELMAMSREPSDARGDPRIRTGRRHCRGGRRCRAGTAGAGSPSGRVPVARGPAVVSRAPLLLLPQQRRRRPGRSMKRAGPDIGYRPRYWSIRPAGWPDRRTGIGTGARDRSATSGWRLVFTGALATASRAGRIADREALLCAAERTGARPGRRWIVDSRGRGGTGLAGGLWTSPGHLHGP